MSNLNEAELEAVKPVVEQGFQHMIDIAQGLCPEGKTGNLHDSIHTEGSYPYIMLVADAVNAQGQGYARFVEEGTWKQEPQPYMRPAVDAEMVDLIQTLRMALRNFIRK